MARLGGKLKDWQGLEVALGTRPERETGDAPATPLRTALLGEAGRRYLAGLWPRPAAPGLCAGSRAAGRPPRRPPARTEGAGQGLGTAGQGACGAAQSRQDRLLPDFWHLRLDTWRLTARPSVQLKEREPSTGSPCPASAGAGPTTVGCRFTQSGGSHRGRTAAK